MAAAMLVTRVGGLSCALPIEHVVETMRPLPIEPIGGASGLTPVEGLAIIRGAPVPVVDARKLLGVLAAGAGRFVVVRIANRRVALVVDAVVEVTRVDRGGLPALPPLFGGAQRDCISAIGALDAGLLVVLDAARVLSDEHWRAIEAGGGS